MNIKKIAQLWAAAVAQWICLLLKSRGPWFESQA